MAQRWGERPLPDITILPDQATRIASVAVATGGAVGVSQSGSTLTIILGPEPVDIFVEGKAFHGDKLVIDAQGHPIEPQKEHLFAQEEDHVPQPLHGRGGD